MWIWLSANLEGRREKKEEEEVRKKNRGEGKRRRRGEKRERRRRRREEKGEDCSSPHLFVGIKLFVCLMSEPGIKTERKVKMRITTTTQHPLPFPSLSYGIISLFPEMVHSFQESGL